MINLTSSQWDEICATLPRPWPRWACVADLARWGEGAPSERQLAARWGWAKTSTRRLIEAWTTVGPKTPPNHAENIERVDHPRTTLDQRWTTGGPKRAPKCAENIERVDHSWTTRGPVTNAQVDPGPAASDERAPASAPARAPISDLDHIHTDTLSVCAGERGSPARETEPEEETEVERFRLIVPAAPDRPTEGQDWPRIDERQTERPESRAEAPSSNTCQPRPAYVDPATLAHMWDSHPQRPPGCHRFGLTPYMSEELLTIPEAIAGEVVAAYLTRVVVGTERWRPGYANRERFARHVGDIVQWIQRGADPEDEPGMGRALKPDNKRSAQDGRQQRQTQQAPRAIDSDVEREARQRALDELLAEGHGVPPVRGAGAANGDPSAGVHGVSAAHHPRPLSRVR